MTFALLLFLSITAGIALLVVACAMRRAIRAEIREAFEEYRRAADGEGM